MRFRRFLGWLSLALALVVPAVFVAMNLDHYNSYRKNVDKRGTVEAEREQLLADLQALKLEFKGYVESISSIPDSTRKAQAGPLRRRGYEYDKQISNMERAHRDLGFDVDRINRSNEKHVSALKRSGAIASVAFVFLIGAGIALVRIRA